MVRDLIRTIKGKKGNEMVEAGLAMPVIILAVLLLVRLFTFYIQILTAGVQEHEVALDKMETYSGKTIKSYETECDIEMIRGGLLSSSLKKTIKTQAYLINEDEMVRCIEISGKK